MNITKPVNFIHFHGITLLVVQHEGIEYVNAKVLNDLIGLNWRRIKETIQGGDNAVLYGTTRLITPNFEELEAPRGLQTPTSEGGTEGQATEKQSPRGTLHIRLDRSRMFLARVNTNAMRVNNNVAAADALLALQIEWADALHNYETHGVAAKANVRATQQQLMGLMKARTLAKPTEQAAFTALIAQLLTELGQPIATDHQQNLPGV